VSKGIGNNLLKVGTSRRRTKEEIRQGKAAETLKMLSIETKMKQFEEMQQELNELRGKKEMLDQAKEVRELKDQSDSIIHTLKQ